MHVHGGFGAQADYTARISVKLDSPVDETILRRALAKAQKRYPYLNVHLKKGEGAFYYVKSPGPVALLHTDDRITLNSDETNGTVWAVCWNEDRIHLDTYHGVTDGTGMYRVLATLLYYYCNERYGVTEQEGIGLAEDKIPPEELADPQDTIRPFACDIPTAVFVPAFTLETDGGLTPSEPTIWDVEIPEDAFIRFTSENDASPGTMVSLIMARAIDSLYPDRSKEIVSAYVINARPMLDAGKTYHNCLSMAIFNYDERVKGMPLTRQCTVYRGKTFAQSYGEAVRNSVARSAEGIREAARKAFIDRYIERLPDKYETVITEEGGNLSQGQRQLMCIARVMLCQPPMLILDEATSSIDTRTEIRIQRAFAEMMKGRTSFIVAHRLSTIKEADIILVMKDGNIIEQGDHDALMKRRGFYYDLYNSQFSAS